VTLTLTLTIVFQVFDSDLGKDKPLGEVSTGICDLDLDPNLDIDFLTLLGKNHLFGKVRAHAAFSFTLTLDPYSDQQEVSSSV
jgi:hypothetical protein